MITKEIISQITTPDRINSTRVLLRGSLKHFIEIFHFHLCGKQFVFKPFHLLIIKELEDIVFGRAEKKNLIINLIPRYGKSIIAQYLTAWSYTINSTSNSIYTSYSDSLVLSFSDRIRSVIESDLYNKLFKLTFSKTEDSKRKWTLEQGGGLYAAAQGGAITGMGAGVSEDEFGGMLIVDDAIKPEDAKSEIMRAKSISYFAETLSNRLNNPKKTPIIVIMQRLHQDDLCGYLQREEPQNWKVLTIPAYNEETKECIWEEKHSSDFFETLKRQNPFYYYSQFQQQPIAGGNSIFRNEWLSNYYDELPDFSRVIQSWDTAFKKGAENDFSVCLTFGVRSSQFGETYYLVDMWRGKVEYPDLKRKFAQLQEIYKPSEILIEDKASGQSLIQDLRGAGNNKLVAIKVDADKETRANAITSILDNNRLFLPRDASWLQTLRGEMLQFPNGTHDDCVDALTQALNHLNKPRTKIMGFSI